MRVSVYAGNKRHQRDHSGPMAEGLNRHGVEVQVFEDGTEPTADLVVAWGWRECSKHVRPGRHVLCMERGYVGDRFRWTSLGWDGLNGRARFPHPRDHGERFMHNFGNLMYPWRHGATGFALVAGQCAGDQSLQGVDIAEWYRSIIDRLAKAGWADIRFRQHPVEARAGIPAPELGVPYAPGALSEVLPRAGLVCTYNSNLAVDALMFGVPCYVQDLQGSMASYCGSTMLQRWYPDRSTWCAQIAWCQWTIEEIRDGTAWEVVREVVE